MVAGAHLFVVCDVIVIICDVTWRRRGRLGLRLKDLDEL